MCLGVGLIFGCTPPEKKGCGQFRTGTFEYRSGVRRFIINRADTVQMELDKTSGATLKTHVKWVNDCSYELTLLNPAEVYADSVQHIVKNAVVTVHIQSWTDTYYIYDSRLNGEHPSIDTLWIVK